VTGSGDGVGSTDEEANDDESDDSIERHDDGTDDGV